VGAKVDTLDADGNGSLAEGAAAMGAVFATVPRPRRLAAISTLGTPAASRARC